MWKKIAFVKETSDWTDELSSIACRDEDSGCDATMSDYPEEHAPSCRYHAKKEHPDYSKKQGELFTDGMEDYQESFVQ